VYRPGSGLAGETLKILARVLPRLCSLALFTALALFASQDRILTPIDPNATTPLVGHVSPQARPEYDQGEAEPTMALSYVTLVLKPDPSIEPFLDNLQTPSSPTYHRWITPAQFGDRFGLTRSDMAKVVAWLESQGLKVNDVAQGRHWVTFSGSAAVVGRALHTTIHRYQVNGKLHFANASEPRIPTALAPVVAGFGGLHDFGPAPLVRLAPVQPQGLAPNYNSSNTHFLAPDDFATIYDVAPLYAAGIDGTGQKLVIVGESDVSLTDLHAFRTLFKLPVNDPQMVLVGSDPGMNGAQVEADLDLEWSAAVARNATVIYVYSSSVSVAAEYAIDQNLAQLMSESFGGCEQYDSSAFRAVAQQASAQGITWFASSGDAGATTCDRAALTPQANLGLTVSSPASIPEITAVGGTSYDDSSGGYWAARNSSTEASALSYIPERAWNDSRTGFEATGGGASAYFPKPAWQTGPGVPNDGARDLPDVSLDASPVKYPYLIESGGSLLAVGGTSASSPTFAGIAALLSQYLAVAAQPGLGNINPAQTGLGNINPALYRLAQATTDVFHDITVGDNEEPCSQGSPACVNGLAGYTAGPHYDQTTGLGSVDVYNLVMEWNSGIASSTTLTASPGTAGLSDTVELIATVTAGSGSAAPTGDVAFVVNGISAGTASLTGSGSTGTGTATVSVSGTALAVGNGVVSALYSGDGVFTGSAGSATVSIQVPTTTGSYVVPFVNPSPVPPAANEWPYTVGLTEIAGVSTTLTSFTVNGVTQSLNSWSSTKIPAHGTVFALLAGVLGATAPINRTFAFGGTDANGQRWTQQVGISFTAPTGASFGPSMSLTSASGQSVAYNAPAASSCGWYIPLSVQQLGGYYMQLSQLTVSGANLTSQIQSIFGTTRLAPYGSLQGNLCFSSAGSQPASVSLTANIEDGYLSGTVAATLSAAFPSDPGDPASLSASPQTVTMPAPDSSGNSSAAVALNFGGAGTAWSASVSVGNSNLHWLTSPQLSGTGPGQLTLQASAAGLSPGAYNATVSIYAPTAAPPVISIPVTLVVGSSSTLAITGLQNAFSFQSTFAPGMSMSVYGTNLSQGTQAAASLPLPLSMQGITATVNGVAAPLYYVSPGQLNIQIPYETGAGPAVVAVNNAGRIAAFPFTVTMTAPGLYSSAINNATGQPASSATAGTVLLLFMTGDGDITPFLATGATPSSSTAAAQLPKPRLPVAVTVGGVAATVLFAGIPAGLTGVTQIDFTVPANAPPGAQEVVVTVGGVAAPPVMLTVQ
jgi:uncharacterized protein (TIGR03437 family)